jgi:uncharacterized protein YaiL (DUF2058 family)
MSYTVYREENRIQKPYSYRERIEEDRKKLLADKRQLSKKR